MNQNREYPPVCLFEHYKLQPPELAKICEKYSGLENPSYPQCEAFLKEVEAIGFTFDYYLDGVPYHLRPIGMEIPDTDPS